MRTPFVFVGNNHYDIGPRGVGTRTSVDGGDIWVLPLEGDRQPRPVVKTSFPEGAAKFSPDGQWLVYSSMESGKSEVYVQSVLKLTQMSNEAQDAARLYGATGAPGVDRVRHGVPPDG